MNKLILIDGSSLLSTSFYATLDSMYHRVKTDEERQVYINKLLKTSDGTHINGVYGMLKSIIGMIDKVSPSHIAIAWDISRNTFRRKLYPPYKGTRKKTIPELKSQFSVAQEIFNEMGFSQFMFNDYEADDVLGTLSRNLGGDVSIRIWTKDQDALQLIDDFVYVWLVTSKANDYHKEVYGEPMSNIIPNGIFEFNPYSFKSIYEIEPIQLVDRKAIEGDKSDNIPGIHGVGEKTSLALLQEFGSIECIYDFLERSNAGEMKSVFKELGISSPLKKMMNEISFKDIVNELIPLVNFDLIDIELPFSFCKDSDETLIDSLLAYEDTDKKGFKLLLKTLSKQPECREIIERLGTFESGYAKEMAFLSKKLATIVCNIPELKDVCLEDLLFVNDTEKFNKVFNKYEFKSLIKKS